MQSMGLNLAQNYCFKYKITTSTKLCYNKNIRFDFDDELKIGDVRYKHLTKITIKVQLF